MRQLNIFSSFSTLLLALLFSCSSENANDCLQTEGDLIREEFSFSEFDKIRIEKNMILVLKQGATQKVVLETGENLRNDVDVRLDGETLVARDNNGCNLFRDYGVSTLFVTSPNIVQIINGSSFEVRSDGVLSYPEISLRSLVIPEFDLQKSGSFFLTLNSEVVSVTANGSSVFYLDGNTDNLNINFSDELPRLEAKDLLAQNVSLRHVSSNHMFVNPQESLTAELRGSGNVYSFNEPPAVEIDERYTGRVFFVEE